MNILDNIKGTLLSVPKGITTSIKSLSTHDSARNTAGDTGTSVSAVHQGGPVAGNIQELNYDAGAELLSRFQNAWSDMHQKSESNAKQAKIADKKISELSTYFGKQNDALGLFLQEISTLPQLLHNLQTATELIQNLEQQFEVVESELMKLEDTCERQELMRNRHHHEYQLMAYKQRRAVELEQAKAKLAKDHAMKVQRYEYNLQKGLREKQQAFEASFKEEMFHYKKYGKPSRQFQIQKTALSKEVDLSNFMPEIDVEAEARLNEFLQTETDGDNAAEGIDSGSKHGEETDNKNLEISTRSLDDSSVQEEHLARDENIETGEANTESLKEASTEADTGVKDSAAEREAT